MKTLSITQINKIIKDIIDNEVILEDVMITGELSSFSISRKIAYFTLKENDNLLSCVQFGLESEFQIGDMVTVKGSVKYYPKGGKITFNAYHIEMCGMGELYQRFLKLKAKLEKEGLFDQSYKIPLPRFINSIGVITSKKGAVLQDIKNITSRRNPNIDIYVYDTQVQGSHAVKQIIEGITYFDNYSDVDVIIVARGGGSIEDLAPFNDEELANIVHICNKPIISAVGHETDFTIIDFVSDLRAPTPSAAAELVTFDLVELKKYLHSTINNLTDQLKRITRDLSNEINYTILNINNVVTQIINDELLYINNKIRKMDYQILNTLDKTKYRVEMSLSTLDKLNPARLLKSGYSYSTIDNIPINFDNINKGDEIKILTSNVKVDAIVKYKEKI